MVDLDRLHGDDHEYFHALESEHGQLVLSICQRYALDFDEVQDLYQQAWIQAWRSRRTYKARGALRAWLSRITANCCISYRRARAREAELFRQLNEHSRGAETAWHFQDPAITMARSRYARMIRAAVEELPERQRKAVALYFFEDLTTEEVAEEMGVAQATVRSHVRHALHGLRTILDTTDAKLSRYDSVD